MLFLILAAFNMGIYSLIFSRTSIQKASEGKKFFVFILMAVGLFVAHVLGFFMLKESNLYEKHNEPRITFEDVLNKKDAEISKNTWFETTKPTDPVVLEQYILNYTAFRIFYDKYGNDLINAVNQFEYWGQVRNYVVEKNTFESFAFYFACISAAAYFSKKLGYNALKKWMGMLIAVCFFLELELVLELFPKEGAFGYYFPNMAAFEKILFAKILIIALGGACRAYYAYIKTSKLQKMEKVHQSIISTNNRLASIFDVKKKVKADTPNPEIHTVVNEIEESTARIAQFIEKEKKYREEKMNDKRSQAYGILILILIGSVIYQFPFAQEYVLENIRARDIGPEDLIKI